uniref:Uncharacterized protein n=1 Tax=Anguilla anguilla TaxID=7936 RepID=A0A0E9XVE8_ANGAN
MKWTREGTMSLPSMKNS